MAERWGKMSEYEVVGTIPTGKHIIRSSWITPHHFIFQELISVILSPPITPNKFWRFNKRNFQEIYTTLSCP